MKKFKKIIVSAFVVLVTVSVWPTRAEKFEYTEKLFNAVADSVDKSGFVKGRPMRERTKRKGRRGAGNKVCAERLELLYKIRDNQGITDSQVVGIVGSYLHDAHLNPNTTLEGQLLRRSGNAEDLMHNVNVIIAIYEDLKEAY